MEFEFSLTKSHRTAGPRPAALRGLPGYQIIPISEGIPRHGGGGRWESVRLLPAAARRAAVRFLAIQFEVSTSMPEVDTFLNMKIITDSRCTEYSQRGHPERPQRIAKSIEKLHEQNDLAITWAEPKLVEEHSLLRAHSEKHLRGLEDPLTDFDPDTPAYPEIHLHARRSVGGALACLDLARAGERAFSLLRPPGHHATQNRVMGFCYLNSVAIAALEARASGAKKVAVFDFDVHHGNGTEAILLDQEKIAFFSVHQYPAYPGTGRENIRNCHNYPVPPGSDRQTYRQALSEALADMKQFDPEIVAVSAGFDAYRGDPLSDQSLEAEDFHWIGERLKEFDRPLFSILEGGYSHALPDLILAYLRGLEGRKFVNVSDEE